MIDSCVLYNIDEKTKKLFKIKVMDSIIKTDIKINPKKLIFLSPKNTDDLKKAIRQMLPYGVINSELIFHKDSTHFIKSGIDDSIAKEMGEKKIAMIFNLNLLISLNPVKKSLIIRRMKRNMQKAIKYDIPVLFASCAKDKYELFNSMQIKTWANYLGIDTLDRIKNSYEKII